MKKVNFKWKVMDKVECPNDYIFQIKSKHHPRVRFRMEYEHSITYYGDDPQRDYRKNPIHEKYWTGNVAIYLIEAKDDPILHRDTVLVGFIKSKCKTKEECEIALEAKFFEMLKEHTNRMALLMTKFEL